MSQHQDTATGIAEPVNSLGLMLAVAGHAANLPHCPATLGTPLAEKMAHRHGVVNTDTIDQLWLVLRRDLRGVGARAKLRALVDQAHETIYLEGWPVPTGRLSMEDRARLRVAMAQHSRTLCQQKAPQPQ